MFTSMDVYDAASVIGHECQLIVSQYGPEIVQGLMPKVISMLEELENCAVYCEKEKDEIIRLQQMTEELRQDCRSQAALKEKCDQNLEQLEQSWYCETQKLLDEVTSLEEENNRLAHQLASEVSADADAAAADSSDPGIDSDTTSRAKPGVSSVLRAAVEGKTETVSTAMQVAAKAMTDKLQTPQPGILPIDMISSVLSETEERLQMSEQESKRSVCVYKPVK
ncbi:unnamed protein product [Echinostoma caproni]|uniref:RH1 domain-containing protein n=1 Tax=Echinostoma caproni TaxID=27848 RepID=A0A183AST6_9TREM|nr:unnamed protein product [Echinostoma caproni]